MGEIERKDYETITARCDECGARRVYNRIDDIGDLGPYSGREITCLECGKPFWIYGDIINPAYELFIFDADEHIDRKHYMLCVSILTQAWEMFFSTSTYSNYLWRSFYDSARYPGKHERFNSLAEQLGDAIQNFTFDPLRNVLVNTIVEGVHPDTLDESEVAIARIRGDNFRHRPAKTRVKGIPNTSVRDVLMRLQDLRINEVRNKVAHKNAYRPSRAEVDECYGELEVLYDTMHLLSIRTLDQWRAASEPLF